MHIFFSTGISGIQGPGWVCCCAYYQGAAQGHLDFLHRNPELTKKCRASGVHLRRWRSRTRSSLRSPGNSMLPSVAHRKLCARARCARRPIRCSLRSHSEKWSSLRSPANSVLPSVAKSELYAKNRISLQITRFAVQNDRLVILHCLQILHSHFDFCKKQYM